MRLKILVLALVSALVAVSAAVAKDHPGKGPKQNSHGCKPAVTVMLAGTLAADVDPQDGDTSLVLTMKHSNRHGRAYKAAGTATILVDAKSRVRRQGAKNLGALAPNDRVHVTAMAPPNSRHRRSARTRRLRRQIRAPSSRQRSGPEASERAPLALLRPSLYSSNPSRRPIGCRGLRRVPLVRYSWRFRADVRLSAFRSSSHSR